MLNGLNECYYCGEMLDIMATEIEDEFGNPQSICGECSKEEELYGSF